MTFEDLEGVVAYLGIASHLGKIRADKGEWFFLLSLFEEVNSLDPFFIEDTAPDPIGRVGWIGYDAPALKRIDHLSNESWLRILMVDGN